MVAVLDDRRSEAALPDMAAGPLPAVVPTGVSDSQGLENPADRLLWGRLEQQVKMVGHQTVAEERKRVTCLGVSEIAQERIPLTVGAENIGPVVPAVDRVVSKVIACRSWKSSHDSRLPNCRMGSNNDELTPGSPRHQVPPRKKSLALASWCARTRVRRPLLPDGAVPAGRWPRTNWRAPTKKAPEAIADGHKLSGSGRH